ncbi:MAG: sterol desaturase family protein [Bacteroidota bacterium]
MEMTKVLTGAVTNNLLRYFVVSGIFFLIFYVLFKNQWKNKKLQLKFPKLKDYQREIVYSMITIAIFGIVAVMVFGTPLRQYTQAYPNISDYGWGYWILSIVLMLVVHDTYFYWMHRLMHAPKLFKYVHLIHHKSTNPSPWASYAFHPIEGFVEAGIIFPIAFLIPFHRTALFTFLAIMIVYNVYGHLGFELYPKGFNKTWIGKWINTSVNHNQHHKKFTGNYGLYFLWWDRWMGTLREDYDEAFAVADAKR